MNQVKVGLVVGEEEWLITITNLIHPCHDLRIAWTATTPEEALQLFSSTPVDILVVDSNLAGGRSDGMELVQRVTVNHKVKARVIMISEYHHEEFIARAFLIGAVNYVFKENVDEIPEVIRSAFKQNRVYETLIKYYQKTHQELLLSRLTPSERDIYLLRKEGRSIGQIAMVTHKSEGTVKNQSSRAVRKLKDANYFLE